MMTAAVRDLHRCYPGTFLTDVRTPFPALWENNPHLTPLREEDGSVVVIDCKYPLINQANLAPYHAIHGYIEFLNDRLGLHIKPTRFKGDIHLSAQEMAWYSQVRELAKIDIPFWIIAAGGKHDLTIKWWSASRFQEVVDHFRGKIQFVQVGRSEHHHPKLEGAVDLRGRTNMRELVRLVHHSQGVLCPVTSLMHLAAAVPSRQHLPPLRPCVVIAGGREPSHWEAYPGHQFIHTIGALACCKTGGCWRDRTRPLRDGDRRDRSENLCIDVVHDLPRCMDMIDSAEVVRRIESYFSSGLIKYLHHRHLGPALRAVKATQWNRFDKEPLHLSSAGRACDQFIATVPEYPSGFQGRGIVICGGGVKYFTNAWVCINMLRRFGCRLPIQVWHLGEKELDGRMRQILSPLGVECIDARRVKNRFPVRTLGGWELKPYACLHSPYKEVMLLDADNVPLTNPDYLFETAEFRETGAVFWPDYPRKKTKKLIAIWRSTGMRVPSEPEFESGQIVLDKARCWRALNLTLWFNENSDFYYQYIHGDKETFHLAFRKLRQPYTLVRHPIIPLEGTMCQHDFEGRRIFQHRNLAKWDLFSNQQIAGFLFEPECQEYIRLLRQVWDGRLNVPASSKRKARRPRKIPRIEAVMISFDENSSGRQLTMDNLRQTDWQDSPIHIHSDGNFGDEAGQRRIRCFYTALKNALCLRSDYVLFLEDRLHFNRHIRHNLSSWPALERETPLAGLFNPRLPEQWCDIHGQVRAVHPKSIFSIQAFLLSKNAISYMVDRWKSVPGSASTRIARLAGRLDSPVLFHAPSLAQQASEQNVRRPGGQRAFDFDPNWKA